MVKLVLLPHNTDTIQLITDINSDPEMDNRLSYDYNTPSNFININHIYLGFEIDGTIIGYLELKELSPCVAESHIKVLQQYRQYSSTIASLIVDWALESNYTVFYAYVPDYIADVNHYMKKLGMNLIGSFISNQLKYGHKVTMNQYLGTIESLLNIRK